MKIQIEVTQEQLQQIQVEGQLLDYLESDLRVKFPSLWSHIYDKGHHQATAEAEGYCDHNDCGCECC